MPSSSIPTTKHVPIPLFLFTYNCNQQDLIPEVFKSKLVSILPDQLSSLYVFGFQEFCSVLDGLFASSASAKLINFNQMLQSALQEKYHQPTGFSTISSTFIGAIGMIIITPYAAKFKNVRTATTSCGYAYSSLKGGVGARVSYYPEGALDSSDHVELSFATAHLNAYEGEYYYLQRNTNLYNIIRSLNFGDGYGLIKPENHVFILGDLNYRTSQNYTPNDAESQELLSLLDVSATDAAYSKRVEELVDKYDELKMSMQNGDVLQNFSEGKITFPPTYKFHLNTAIYNTKRSPSWCDRVVYLSSYEEVGPNTLGQQFPKLTSSSKANHDEIVRQSLPEVKEYNSLDSLLMSDHRPIYLEISVPFSPPQSIISPLSGCMQILPAGLKAGVLLNETSRLEALERSSNVVSGPTTLYLKPTTYDNITQNVIRPLSNTIIGYGIWLGGTRQGRLFLLTLIFIVWVYFRFF
ncbi:hypothetical protein KGF57_003049 [Candida theae]|uniref:Inositol polyphosphate-related phosphatase domain-containing protein n=1 Tax=Candida theae TaxID=1198502 RepID=A0AAD5BE09_9ASCO|nr:uncharacterized protein KGF57_003049 [Candida theae]KAI5957782.1 hypothetical protein KGF57_003049 [Candida theae]